MLAIVFGLVFVFPTISTFNVHEAIQLHTNLLIPGRHSPGSDMDVCFEPLVYDLLDMFKNGVRTYDASKGEFFQLRAAVLWTISDFPGLGYVFESITAGETTS